MSPFQLGFVLLYLSAHLAHALSQPSSLSTTRPACSTWPRAWSSTMSGCSLPAVPPSWSGRRGFRLS